MRLHCGWSCRIVVFLAISAPWSATAETLVHSFTVEDPLRRRLGPQVVSEVFRAEEGVCTPETVGLVGPAGALPCQLSDVEVWPDGKSIKSGRLWTIVNLDQRGSHTMRLVAGARPSTQAGFPSGLTLVETPTALEVSTPSFGIRFSVGTESFSPPSDASAVAPPVVAMGEPGKPWDGGSALYGPKRIVLRRSTIEARGPVFVEVRHRYDYDDGTVLDLVARVVAGGSTIDWSMGVTPIDAAEAVRHVVEPWPAENPLAPRDPVHENGWRLLFSKRGDPALTLATGTEFGSNRWGERSWDGRQWVEGAKDIAIADQPAGLLVNLVPWHDWWDDQTKTEIVIRAVKSSSAWSIRALEAGAWVEPAAPGTWAPWGNRRMRQKWVPVVRDTDGSVYFQFSLASGQRRFRQGSGREQVGTELDETRRRVLRWPEARHAYPRLYMSRKEVDRIWQSRPDEKAVAALVAAAGTPGPLPTGADCAAIGAWLLTGDRRVAGAVGLVDRLKVSLGLLGEFDRMRLTALVAGMYDAVMGGPPLSDEERRLFRAQIAYLAYRTAAAENWSMERGYCSGNLNMSVAHVCNQGVLACLLSDHPEAEHWVKNPLAFVDKMLAERVGPAGEWPESVANYASVSISSLLPFAVAASRAGWRDDVNDVRMKRLMLYIAKQYTPPDPRPGEGGVVGVSRLPPVGRGGAGGSDGLTGLMAKATAESDPAYSAGLQWVWRRCGMPRAIPDARLGGWEHVYLDARLPVATPSWSLDVFPDKGAIMRHGLGTSDEWYAYLTAEREYDFLSERGGIPMVFARGVPIIAHFAGGYAEREELFINRVLPARPSGSNEFRMNHFQHEGECRLTEQADLPAAQYLRGRFSIGKPRFLSHESTAHDRMKAIPSWPEVPRQADGPIDWDRQILFAKDTDPCGANSIFLRDTVAGGQPTIWHMWFVSDGIGAGRRQASAPKDEATAAQALTENPLVARGRYGIDTDIFIAAPEHEPRHTLRWETQYNYRPLNGVREAMDLLHLQRSGDGAYFVAMFPRARGDERPAFASLGDGHVIKVSTAKGVDYGFLADHPTFADAESVRFQGTAGTVAYRATATTASLAARGGIQFAHDRGPHAETWELAATAPVSVRLEGDTMVVWGDRADKASGVRVAGPAQWRAVDAIDGIRVEHRDDGLRLTTDGKAFSLTLQRDERVSDVTP